MSRISQFASVFCVWLLPLIGSLILTSCASVQIDPLQITQNSKTPTIIAMGDMHGDYGAYEGLMLASGLMDRQGNWSGGNAIFVQTGDIPDRGADTRKIIESLQRLERQAPQSGGKLIPLVGNHEAMNMTGDLRYVHPGEFAAFAVAGSKATRDAYYTVNKDQIETRYRRKNDTLSSEEIKRKWYQETPPGIKEHRDVWSPDGYIGKWVARNQLVAKVQGYLFAHGGYSKEYTSYSLDDMNTAGRKALLARNTDRKSILRDKFGPLWYRGLVRGRGEKSDVTPAQEIDLVLKTYDATHIIIGHTRNEEGIRVSLNGKLFQIDTGASAAYGGVPSFLRIENGEFFAHTMRGFKKLEAAN